MINVIVNGKVNTLSIKDSNGTEYVRDFIGNWGAFDDGQFTWDDEQQAYISDEYTLGWWQSAIEREETNAKRIEELKELHGSEKVNEVVEDAARGYNDLEDIQNAIASALNELGN